MLDAGSIPIKFFIFFDWSGFSKIPSLQPNSSTFELSERANLFVISSAYYWKWSESVFIAEEK